jgi:hypothetical protein
LSITPDLDADFFAAIGEITGEVHMMFVVEGNTSLRDMFAKISLSASQNNVSDKCPGAPQQHVKIGDRATVCTKNDGVYLRESHNKNGKIIDLIAPGTNMKIIGGPYCTDNWSWWYVETISDKEEAGWVSEGGDNIDPYFICPIK